MIFLLENYDIPASGENNSASPVCPRISQVPTTGDYGIWFKGKSLAPTLRNVRISLFGDHAILLDSTGLPPGIGNIDHWQFEQIFCYQNAGDGLHTTGGSDANVGTAINFNATQNLGWGINLDSGAISNVFIKPHIAGNTTGGVRVNNTSNYFYGLYMENTTTSLFLFDTSADNNFVQFSQFGQPSTITNNGGPSNVFVYSKNNLPGYANLAINPQTPSNSGRTYRLQNGQFNLNDFSIADDLGKTFIDFNQGFGATLFPLPVRISNLTAATSAGSTNGEPLKLDSEFWNPAFAGAGTVNTSGISVTQVTGNTAFTAAMVGQPIVINSVSYTVATFVDSTHITLSTSAGTQSGVSWSATLAASGLDEWQIQTIGGSGSNGTSALTVTHSGSTGAATLDLENVATDTSASAGSHGAVPAQVAAYLDITVNGTAYKMPLFLP